MNEDSESKPVISGSVPIGALAAGVIVGAAVLAAYLLTNRDNGDVASSVKSKARSGKGFGRKLGLMTAITLIENDATRKVVLAVLKAIARRA